MSLLSQVSCTRLRAGEPPASPAEVAELHPFVPAWSVVDEAGVQKLRNTFLFDDETGARRFVELLGQVGEKEGHQPEIQVVGRRVTLHWWSSEVGGLHPNDFIMAGKADGVYTQVLVGAVGDMMTDEALPPLAALPRFRHAFAHRAPVKKKEAG